MIILEFAAGRGLGCLWVVKNGSIIFEWWRAVVWGGFRWFKLVSSFLSGGGPWFGVVFGRLKWWQKEQTEERIHTYSTQTKESCMLGSLHAPRNLAGFASSIFSHRDHISHALPNVWMMFDSFVLRRHIRFDMCRNTSKPRGVKKKKK